MSSWASTSTATLMANLGSHLQDCIWRINSLAPGRFECNFRSEIFKLILVIDRRGISGETALRWMSLDYTDNKSILVQVMALWHQATSHYLSQCRPRSMLPYGVTRPQWVEYRVHNITAVICNVSHDLPPTVHPPLLVTAGVGWIPEHPPGLWAN